MKINALSSQRHWVLFAALLLIFLLAACGPAPLGVSWAGVSKLEGSQYIVVANHTYIVMVDPVDGTAVRLRDADGDLRPPDEQGNPLVWNINSPDSNTQFYSSPAQMDENTLLLAAYNKKLFEVDLLGARINNPTGVTVIERPDYIVADVYVGENMVYIGLSSQDLIALDREDLTERWTLDTEHGVFSEPLEVDGVLYVASLDRSLYAVNAETGDLLWKTELEGVVASKPAYFEGRLFIGSFGNKIFELSMDGEILNQYVTQNWVWGTPVIVDGVLYAADLGGYVYALDTNDNLNPVWAPQRMSETASIRSSPIVSGDYIVVGSRDRRVYWLNRSTGLKAIDESGSELVREVKDQVLADLILIEPDEAAGITQPLVVVSTLSAEEVLVAFTLDRGERQWVYRR